MILEATEATVGWTLAFDATEARAEFIDRRADTCSFINCWI